MVLVEGGFFKIVFPHSLRNILTVQVWFWFFIPSNVPRIRIFLWWTIHWCRRWSFHTFGLNTRNPFLKQHFADRNIVFGKILKKKFHRQLRSAFWRIVGSKFVLRCACCTFNSCNLWTRRPQKRFLGVGTAAVTPSKCFLESGRKLSWRISFNKDHKASIKQLFEST